jgi:NAD(P)-dependent dehydrogenase (short-subunit alcohol dehydrogenase family)
MTNLKSLSVKRASLFHRGVGDEEKKFYNIRPKVFGEAVWLTRQMVERQFSVNVVGSWAVSQTFLPYLMQSKGKNNIISGNTKGGSITVPLTSCLTGLELAV